MNWAQNILDDENVFPNKIGEDVLVSLFKHLLTSD
jgi:hypothetical protein